MLALSITNIITQGHITSTVCSQCWNSIWKFGPFDILHSDLTNLHYTPRENPLGWNPSWQTLQTLNNKLLCKHQLTNIVWHLYCAVYTVTCKHHRYYCICSHDNRFFRRNSPRTINCILSILMHHSCIMHRAYQKQFCSKLMKLIHRDATYMPFSTDKNCGSSHFGDKNIKGGKI